MSMSVRDDATGLEYAGALGPRGLFATCRNLARPAYLRMLVEIPRFHRRARALLPTGGRSTGRGDRDLTLREFLAAGRFSAYFARHFMEPLVAAVWSCDPDLALDYPARYLFSFLEHHGMLAVFGSPQWRTVTGGSHEYVARVAAGLPEVRTRHQGHLGAGDPRRRRGHRRQRRGHDVRRRGRRHPPRPGAGDARRADRGAARGARRAALLPQHRAAAHRHLAAAAGRAARGPPGTSAARRRRSAR